jgi:3-oxoacid CoA-transferase A subunit
MLQDNGTNRSMDHKDSNKVFRSPEAAVAVVRDGASILFAGFGGAGCPSRLITALARQGVRNLTAITNNCGTGDSETGILFKNRQVKRVIASFPGPGSGYFQEQFAAGTIELELVAQGTLCERMRAAGAGIPAFYTPVGAGTEVGAGKEERSFEGRNYVMERALGADFAFLRAHRADEVGNLVYRKAARNFNPVMAMAAKVTIVEVEEIVPAGMLDPEAIVTPGIFVDRIVAVTASANG